MASKYSRKFEKSLQYINLGHYCKHVSGHIRAHQSMQVGGYHYSLFHYFPAYNQNTSEHTKDWILTLNIGN